MPNADNTYGTFNKRTHILSQIGSITATDFDDVDTAKSWFYTSQALTVMDECCTEIQWQVVDNQKLKYTMTFGTKGTSSILQDDDWAEQYNSRKDVLMKSNEWSNNQYTTEESTDHLF